ACPPASHSFPTRRSSDLLDVVRIGASVSTPFNLEGSARIQVRPPSAAAFSGAEVVNRSPGCDWQDPSAPCRGDTRGDVQLEFPRSEEHTSELQSRENLVC